MRISDWSSDVCSSDLEALSNACGGYRLNRSVETARRRASSLPRLRRITSCRSRWVVATMTAMCGAYALNVIWSAPESSSGIERSEEHTSELQSLMRISYSVFCWKQKIQYLFTLNNH